MKQFIEVTDKDKTKYLINVNSIITIYQDTNTCLIILSKSDFIHNKVYLPVTQSYDEVKQLIKDAL